MNSVVVIHLVTSSCSRGDIYVHLKVFWLALNARILIWSFSTWEYQGWQWSWPPNQEWKLCSVEVGHALLHWGYPPRPQCPSASAFSGKARTQWRWTAEPRRLMSQWHRQRPPNPRKLNQCHQIKALKKQWTKWWRQLHLYWFSYFLLIVVSSVTLFENHLKCLIEVFKFGIFYHFLSD